MPWNDNANPGPWGSPSGGGANNDDERRDPPRRPGGGGRGPDLGAGFDQLRRRMRRGLGPGGLQPQTLLAAAGGVVMLWVVSGIYLVQPSEKAVILTFGHAGANDWAGPGLNYHLPYPIQTVEKVAVTTLNSADVGGGASGDDTPAESLMLTGDEQIIDLDFRVTWRVENPAQFLFNVRDPEGAVKAVAESAMREVVGKTPLQPIISTGRGQVQQQTAELMQKTLDSWKAGISIVEVQIRSAGPPTEVIGAFRDVNNAQQDADSAVNEASIYTNRVVNEAKGDAASILQQAEAYREATVRSAAGDAARFNQLYAEYRRAPGVTRDRLYIETMERVLRNSNKVVIDSKGATAPVILPPDVFRARGSQPAPATAPAPAQPTGKGGQ